MTFDDLREYLGGAGDRYGYRGSFDGCKIMLNTPNGPVPVKNVQIQIDASGIGSIVLSPEVPDGYVTGSNVLSHEAPNGNIG